MRRAGSNPYRGGDQDPNLVPTSSGLLGERQEDVYRMRYGTPERVLMKMDKSYELRTTRLARKAARDKAKGEELDVMLYLRSMEDEDKAKEIPKEFFRKSHVSASRWSDRTLAWEKTDFAKVDETHHWIEDEEYKKAKARERQWAPAEERIFPDDQWRLWAELEGRAEKASKRRGFVGDAFHEQILNNHDLTKDLLKDAYSRSPRSLSPPTFGSPLQSVQPSKTSVRERKSPLPSCFTSPREISPRRATEGAGPKRGMTENSLMQKAVQQKSRGTALFWPEAESGDEESTSEVEPVCQKVKVDVGEKKKNEKPTSPFFVKFIAGIGSMLEGQ